MVTGQVFSFFFFLGVIEGDFELRGRTSKGIPCSITRSDERQHAKINRNIAINYS